MEGIKLSNGHLVIDAEIVAAFFGQESHTNIVYYPQKSTLMLASVTDDLFKGLHKTSMVMLKLKSSRGDKSISIEEVLIDNDIDSADRVLNFHADAAMKIISVYFSGEAI